MRLFFDRSSNIRTYKIGYTECGGLVWFGVVDVVLLKTKNGFLKRDRINVAKHVFQSRLQAAAAATTTKYNVFECWWWSKWCFVDSVSVFGALCGPSPTPLASGKWHTYTPLPNWLIYDRCALSSQILNAEQNKSMSCTK